MVSLRTLAWLLVALITGCSTCGGKVAPRAWPALTRAATRAGDGFTTLDASKDTLKFYVSNAGSDANAGRTEDAPLKTVAAGLAKLRTGHADWLLFKRGDHWDHGFGNWNLSGRSATEPMVIGAYGTGPRPLFRTGVETAITTIGGAGSAEHDDHVWFIGLDFYANGRDPADPAFDGKPSECAGIFWLRGTTDLLVEDCVFRFFGGAVVFQNADNLGISGVRLRRDQFLDSYMPESAGHSQGVYIDGTTGVLFEEDIFDHNGWNEQVPGANKTIFNHNLYVQNGNKNIVVKNNIFLRGASHGVQLRPGGIADGNLFAYNAISLLIGGGNEPDPGGVDGELKDNVILRGTDIGREPRGIGIDLQNVRAVTVANNIVANAETVAEGAPIPLKVPGVKYARNVVYNWPKGKSTDDAHPNPARDLATYDAKLGGPGTFEHFVQELRAQSQQNWRNAYTAQAINDYIRAGFQAPE